MDQDLEHHYSHLAETYDATWGHRPDYLDWMETRINARLDLRPGDWIADIGAGTGLFLRRLLQYATEDTPVVCVDPSQPMLDRLPRDPRLLPVCATAEELAAPEAGRTGEGTDGAEPPAPGPGPGPGSRAGTRAGSADGSGTGVRLPVPQFSAIVIKEAVHHFSDLTDTLRGLARRLVPGGRMLIVTLPPKIDYPLFQRALDRFAANQPEPEDIEAALREAGLEASTTYDAYRVRVDRDHWLSLVEGQWMSVLSSFSDTELAEGLAEIRQTTVEQPDGRLEFPDRFAFIEARAPRTRGGG